MSDPNSHQEEHQLTEAERIAQHTTAKQYFMDNQHTLLQEWGQKSLDLFKFSAEVFMREYELKSSGLIDTYGQNFQELYAKCRKEFQAYCILNRKVQKKNDEIQNFAAFFNAKNTKKTFFNGWKEYSTYQKHLRSMQDRVDRESQLKTLKNCLKAWNQITMKSNRMKIKNEVLHLTQIEINKVQQEYQKIIRQLQQTLQKKLTQLKKQDEEHKLLHDKYESMYGRGKLNNSGGLTR